MNKVPSNPLPIDGDCAAGDYVYTQTGGGTGYFLSYCLGGQVSNISAGNKCALPYNHTAEPGNVGSFPGNTGANPQPECSPCVCGDCTTLNCNGLADFATSTASCVVGDTTYKAIKVGDQCWLNKNLNIGTRIAGATDMTTNATLEKWCYNDTDSICTSDGALYSWAEMMYLPSACNSSASGSCAPAAYVTGSGATAKRQGICPKGWHVPSDYELTVLENYLDPTVTLGNNPDYYADQSGPGGINNFRGTNIGTQLKPNGTSHLNFLLAGYRVGGTFYLRSSYGFFWSASRYFASSSWRRYVYSGNAQANRGYGNMSTDGVNVRCLKD